MSRTVNRSAGTLVLSVSVLLVSTRTCVFRQRACWVCACVRVCVHVCVCVFLCVFASLVTVPFGGSVRRTVNRSAGTLVLSVSVLLVSTKTCMFRQRACWVCACVCVCMYVFACSCVFESLVTVPFGGSVRRTMNRSA